MLFQINFKSGKAAYVQLVEQVRAAVASGALRDGDSLPGIRPLAEDLRLNRNTVAKAYADLERQGVIQTVAGKGCFVRSGSTPLKKDARKKMLSETIDVAVVHAHHLQISKSEFLGIAEERFDSLEDKRARAAQQ
jgi:GntR family transcriptional regulator